MAFCLVPKIADEFLRRIKSGELKPEQLSEMTSKERRAYFADFMGVEAATKTNALFEKNLLLKNKQKGMLNWAKQVSGLKPEVARDIVSRIERMDERILNPKEEAAFLEDLTAQKMGASVTFEEAKKIFELSEKVEKLKPKAESSKPKSQERQDYGEALYDLLDFVSDAKEEKFIVSGLVDDFKREPFKTIGKAAVAPVKFTASLSKSALTTLDNSALGTQGFKVFFSKNGIWRKNALKSFQDIWNTFGGKNVKRAVIGEILGRENSMNGMYKKHKIAIGNIEEAKPTDILSKIPVVGKAFEASDNAFNLFLTRTRADVFDVFANIAKETGGNLEGIGKVVNSMTGRGDLGAFETAAQPLSHVLFSPRWLKSHVDFFTLHAFDKGISNFARKQAALNMVKVIGGITTILGTAYALNPDSVEFDPRSSDFGKIRVGDTRYDVTGGLAPLAILASRILTASTKSTSTGKITKLNTGEWGSRTIGDVFIDFFANKMAPLPGLVRDISRGSHFGGDPITLSSSVKKLFVPLPIQNTQELLSDENNKKLSEDVKTANTLAGLLLDFIGIRSNTYGKWKK